MINGIEQLHRLSRAIPLVVLVMVIPIKQGVARRMHRVPLPHPLPPSEGVKGRTFLESLRNPKTRSPRQVSGQLTNLGCLELLIPHLLARFRTAEFLD